MTLRELTPEERNDQLLKGLAAQALNMAKRELQQGKFDCVIATYTRGKGLYRMRKLELLIIEKHGENWLNSGRTKDAGFGMLRLAVDMFPPDAFAFVSIVNAFGPTEKLLAMGVEAVRELGLSNHDRHHQAVAEGLLEVHDELFAIVQDPLRVCTYRQRCNRRGIIGEPTVHFSDQEHWGGRLKMFGEDTLGKV